MGEGWAELAFCFLGASLCLEVAGRGRGWASSPCSSGQKELPVLSWSPALDPCPSAGLQGGEDCFSLEGRHNLGVPFSLSLLVGTQGDVWANNCQLVKRGCVLCGPPKTWARICPAQVC